MPESCKEQGRELEKKLREPFDPKNVEWRVNHVTEKDGIKKALVVAYLQNRAIQERLDEVFGVYGWQNQYKEMHDGIICGITATINGKDITKWDGADRTNIEATKGGLSNSMKRAASQWGIGRYLYKLEGQWCIIKEHSNSRDDIFVNTKYKQQNKKDAWAKGFITPPKLPQWALPEGYQSNDNNRNQNQYQNNNKQKNGANTNNQNRSGLQTMKAKFDRGQAMAAIYSLEKKIGLDKQPAPFKEAILKRANKIDTKVKLDFIKASESELQNYYYALEPVASVVAGAKQYDISVQHLLNICQLVLKKEIPELFSLFFKLQNQEDVTAILDFIQQDAERQQNQTA
jgi:hypothetical protein